MGRGRKGHGQGWVLFGWGLVFSGYNPPPHPPKKSNTKTTPIPPSPCNPLLSPSCRVFVFCLVLICPSALCPTSSKSPFYNPPPSPFYKGFILSKTTNFGQVCERRNIRETPPPLHFIFSLQSMTSPPPPLSSFLEDEGRLRLNYGEV